MKFIVMDRRVIEACDAFNIDVAKATPRERFEAYCRWTLPCITHGESWGDVLLSVAKGCGITRL